MMCRYLLKGLGGEGGGEKEETVVLKEITESAARPTSRLAKKIF
jgi:hypothetical protein